MAGILDSIGNFFTGDSNAQVTAGDPLAGVSPFAKMLIGLGGPDAVDSTVKTKLDLANRAAAQDIAQRMQSGQLDRQSALVEYATRTGDYSKLFASNDTPAAIQEYNFVSKLPPEQQALYFRNKRANQMFDRGDAQVILGPDGKPTQVYAKGLAPEQTPEVKAQQAAATAQGSAAGTAAAAAPGKTADADFMLKSIDDVLGDKGLDKATGGWFGLQGRQAAAFPLGEDQRRVQPKIDQLRGQSFLQAYNNLRGGGQITEIEGTKAENAIARLNQAQEPDDFKKALTDLKEVVEAAKARNAKAGSNLPAATGGAPKTTGGPKVIDFGAL